MWNDISFGVRNMARNPGVTAAVVLTLALGIGANTAMFSVVNAVLLRPLPYPEPDRLVAISAQIPSMNITGAFVEYNTFVEWWRARGRSYQCLSAFTPGTAILTAGGDPERLIVFRVNAGFLGMLGVRPARGRDFLPEEDRPGSARAAILSQRLWTRLYGRGELAGQSIQLNHESYPIVGVLPADFDFYGDDIDVYTPIAAPSARVRGMPAVGAHARLRPGVSVRTAQAELDGLSKGWIAQYRYPKDWGARVATVRDSITRNVRSSVIALGIAVALVLLIACANVANLLLARAGARRREMAVRHALGAGRARIVRQLLTESALLAGLATGIGLLAAWTGVRTLAAAQTGYVPLQRTVSIDAATLAFTLAAALATTLLFGLAPAFAASRTRIVEHLNEGGRGAAESPGRTRFSAALVVFEVALALLLAIGAALTARSLMRLHAVDPGFNPEHVLRASLTLPPASYPTPAARIAFFQELGARVRAIPGVTAAGFASHLPFSNSKGGLDVRVEGAPPPRPGEQMIAFLRDIDPRYFAAMQIRLLGGRFFTDHDAAAEPVVIVNQTMARRGWPAQDAVGKRIAFGERGSFMTVVGVVADLRQTSLNLEPDAEVYLPYAAGANQTMSLALRTAVDPKSLLPAVRAALRGLDRGLPLADTGTLEGDIEHSIVSRRFTVALLGSFSFLALLLAAIGVYAVVSCSAARRTHEIGVRMALGAARGRIVRLIAGQAALLGGLGVVAGAAGGLALTRLLRSMLYGVSATDPFVFAGAALFLLAVAVLAGCLPALRASRVDPAVALRHE